MSSNLVLLSRPKHLELLPPDITTTVEASGESFQVALNVKAVALWTWLELQDADAAFGTNFVHLRPGRTVEVEVTPKTAMSLAEFKKQLTVKSLIDTY